MAARRNKAGHPETTIYLGTRTRNRLLQVVPGNMSMNQAVELAIKTYISDNWDSYIKRRDREKMWAEENAD